MFEWKVNQIRVEMMERVLNHMEKQGYEVQMIVPLPASVSDPSADPPSIKTEVVLAGRKSVKSNLPDPPKGTPAVTPENIEVVYGRQKQESGNKQASVNNLESEQNHQSLDNKQTGQKQEFVHNQQSGQKQESGQVRQAGQKQEASAR